MFTQTEAEKKICPMSLARGDFTCSGSNCMAWVWKMDVLPIKVVTTALPDERAVLRNLVQTSMFPQPPGKGWQAGAEPKPPSTKETSMWSQEWLREQSFADAERKGDCGLKRV